MAKYLTNEGHDVRVLAASKSGYTETLNIEIPEDKVTRTDWFDLNTNIRKIVQKMKGQDTANSALPTQRADGKRSFIAKLYSSLFCIPDNYWGWISPAIKQGKKLIDEDKPDLIITSGGPFSAFIVASKLAKYADIPWIADYRDLWSENHAKPYLRFRRPIDKIIEKNTMKTAKSLISISPLFVNKLSAMHNKTTHLIMNGFDGDDYKAAAKLEDELDFLDHSKLNILYTGEVYHDFQDVSLILNACALLPNVMKDNIRVIFLGRNHKAVKNKAKEIGIEDIILTPGEMPFAKSIAAQQSADLLLFLLSKGPQAHGIFTGKLFEYFGARRPIIATGHYDDGAVCELIKDREAGKIFRNSDELKDVLQDYITQKVDNKTQIASPPTAANKGLERKEQFSKLLHIIEAART